jgi:cytoskeletal protein RodZ
MKWAFRGALAVIVIALGVWVWVTFFPGPEQAIRKRLAELAKLGSFASNEGALAKGLNSQQLASFFAPDVEISVDVPGVARQKLSGRDDLLRAAMAVRTSPLLSSVKVDLLDITITFGPDKTTAVANLTLKVQVNGEKDFTPQEMKFTLKKVNGQWLIREAETVRTLSQALNKLNGNHRDAFA